ncbi:MAG TPA: hypothetical protein QF549_00800 [Candidatus Saccharimonadaceae bacterium]|nr:hypothetical protein [Candidatus Saccharimonadaceae bacterium]|tara:strand:+ start:624 stop:887 length:264 start_codon:yes stop_codon:yes gene_type:complete
MSSAAEILVIIVSVVLAIFLLVGIILGIYLIRLTREIKRIAHSAQQTVDKVGEALSSAAKFTSPIFFAEMIKRNFRKFTKQSNKGDK